MWSLTKDLLPQAYVTTAEFGDSAKPFGLPFKEFASPTVRPWTYLMNVIQETRRAH